MNRRLKSAAIMAALAFATGVLAPTAQAQAPSDPQIVGIVVAANQIDIAAAKQALAKSKNKEVRDFAQQMIADHSALQKSVFELGAKLKVKPAPSDTEKSLKAAAAKDKADFAKLHSAAFDKAYIDHEVAYHQSVIDAVTNTLIPNAQNAELKQALVGAGPAFTGHLEHAKKVQADLASGSSSGMSHK